MPAVLTVSPSHHPLVLKEAEAPLLKALAPRFVASYEQRASTHPKSAHKLRPEVAAEITTQRVLHLLAEEQGPVPVRKAIIDLSLNLPDLDREDADSLWLLEILVECSGLIVPDCEGTSFTLHPEWARRFTKQFAESQAKRLADW